MTIDAKELAYLRFLVEQRAAAESSLNQFVGYLGAVYQLSPADKITLDGQIVSQQRSEEASL